MRSMKAMKYTEVPETKYEYYVTNDEYWFQQKMDGTRVLVTRKPGCPVEFFQRDGKPLSYAAAKLHTGGLVPGVEALYEAAALVYRQPEATMRRRLTFDGELVIHEGNTAVLYVWDVLDVSKPEATYWSRFQMLSRIMEEFRSENPENTQVVQSETVRWTDEKRAFLERAKEAGVEGVMAKWIHEEFRPGERTNTTVKLKFVKEADVVVTGFERGRNDAGREVGSAEFAVLYSDGQWLKVGRCSLIGKPEVEVGSVITVKYLYWTGAAVVQPRMVWLRHDKAPEECTIDQFATYSKEAL